MKSPSKPSLSARCTSRPRSLRIAADRNRTLAGSSTGGQFDPPMAGRWPTRPTVRQPLRTSWFRAPLACGRPRSIRIVAAAFGTRRLRPSRTCGRGSGSRSAPRLLSAKSFGCKPHGQVDHFEDVVDEPSNEHRHDRVTGRLGNRGAAGQDPAVGQGGVRSVEQPEFPLLEGDDVLDDVDADLGEWKQGRLLPSSPTSDAARSSRRRGRRGRAAALICSMSRSVVAGTIRSTTELGNRTVSSIHPGSEGLRRSAISVTRARRRTPLPMTLSREAITGGIRPESRHTGQRPRHHSEGRGRVLRTFQILLGEVVSLFRDGQRHEARARRSQGIEGRGGTGRCRRDRSDDAGWGVGSRLALGHRVEAILWRQLIGDGVAVQRRGADQRGRPS